MALSAAQMADANYLTSLINSLNKQKQAALEQNTISRENNLRQNNMNLQQNMRRLREANMTNGINGGFEESNYARLLAGANSGAAGIRQQSDENAYKIGAQFDPQIAEYQGYLDALRAAQAAAAAAAAGGGGGGGGRSSGTSSNSYVRPASNVVAGEAKPVNYIRNNNVAKYTPYVTTGTTHSRRAANVVWDDTRNR